MRMNALFLILFSVCTYLCCTDPVLGAVNDSEMAENHYTRSVAGMTELLKMEDELIINLNKYLEAAKEKLGIIKFALDHLYVEHRKSLKDAEAYLSNPLNSFALMRRMHSDWFKWQEYMRESVGKEQIEFMEQLQSKMPTKNDLNEAAAAIFRIQETYELEVSDIVKGYLNGHQYQAHLSALDSFAIGNYLNVLNKCDQGIKWYLAALESYSTYESQMFEIFNVNRANILFSMADCWLDTRKIDYTNISATRENSLAVINQAIAEKPDDETFLHFKKDLVNLITHDKLCRHEISQLSRLHCHYNTTTTPFLKLAPLKLEEIAMDPYIVLYHNVLSDSEIDELQTIAKQSMGRTSTKKLSRDPERTGNGHNIEYNRTQTSMRIYNRIFDMTGLKFDMDDSVLQVVNYGVAGHYYNHVDYDDNVNETTALYDEHYRLKGDRIASVVFYFSDVEQGGETAFARINKFVATKKGSAIFWYHLDKAGNGNPNSMHASCPVLFGSKWMAITSTFSYDQMFIKPCAA